MRRTPEIMSPSSSSLDQNSTMTMATAILTDSHNFSPAELFRRSFSQNFPRVLTNSHYFPCHNFMDASRDKLRARLFGRGRAPSLSIESSFSVIGILFLGFLSSFGIRH